VSLVASESIISKHAGKCRQGYVCHAVDQWWSLETWSWSQDPFLHVSVAKVSGLVSVLKAIDLRHKPIALRFW